MGRLWDISSAYKQLPVRRADHSLAVIAVWAPSVQKVELYLSLALPFGAAAAVLGFNWVAAALCHLLCRAFAVGSTNFFDDFHVVEEEGLCTHTEQLITEIVELLGWS